MKIRNQLRSVLTTLKPPQPDGNLARWGLKHALIIVGSGLSVLVVTTMFLANTHPAVWMFFVCFSALLVLLPAILSGSFNGSAVGLARTLLCSLAAAGPWALLALRPQDSSPAAEGFAAVVTLLCLVVTAIALVREPRHVYLLAGLTVCSLSFWTGCFAVAYYGLSHASPSAFHVERGDGNEGSSLQPLGAAYLAMSTLSTIGDPTVYPVSAKASSFLIGQEVGDVAAIAGVLGLTVNILSNKKQ